MTEPVGLGLLLLALTAPSIPIGGELREEAQPASNVVQKATIGSTLYSRHRFNAFPGATASQPAILRTIGGDIEIAAGEALTQVQSRVPFKACSERGPCALDDDGDGTFDRVALDSGSRGLRLKAAVPYQRMAVRVLSTQEFESSILFLGYSGSTLRLGYRELVGGMARPAFSEEYTFTLGTGFPQTIAVKDVKITLLGLDGLGVSYKIEP